MFEKLLGSRSKPRPVLSADVVCTLARDFLASWPPFTSRFDNYVGLSAQWVEDAQGHHHWVAGLTPAIDVKCLVIVSDELAQVSEARIVAMRTGRVQTEWRGSPVTQDSPPTVT
jgi:hypothetical protein